MENKIENSDSGGSEQKSPPAEVPQRQPTARGLSQPGHWMSSPFSFMRRFSEEMDRLFEDFGFSGTRSTNESSREFGRSLWNPPIEVLTKDNQLIVRAELPGLTKDDIKVEFSGDELVIQGEKRQEHKEEHEGMYHSERSYGRFFRRIPLPEGIKAEQAKANFRDGILEIIMKAPQQTKSRVIDIEER